MERLGLLTQKGNSKKTSTESPKILYFGAFHLSDGRILKNKRADTKISALHCLLFLFRYQIDQE